MSQAKSTERVVRDIRWKTRRRFSAEEKIRIIVEGLWGEESIAALIGGDEVAKAVDRVWDAFGQKMDPRAWNVFLHGDWEEILALQNEIHERMERAGG